MNPNGFTLGYPDAATHEFTFGKQPTLEVQWIPGKDVRGISQPELHRRFLEETRSHNGSNDDFNGVDAGSCNLFRSVLTASHRTVDIYFYAWTPSLDLYALIPEKGGMTQICLQASEPEDITRHYDDFVKVLKSYRYGQP